MITCWIVCGIIIVVFILIIDFLISLDGFSPLMYIRRTMLMNSNKGNALYIKQLWSEHPELNNMFWEYTGYVSDAWHSINYLVVNSKSGIYQVLLQSLDKYKDITRYNEKLYTEYDNVTKHMIKKVK